MGKRATDRTTEAATVSAAAGVRAIEVDLPLAPLYELSKVESYNKNVYKPSSYVHKR